MIFALVTVPVVGNATLFELFWLAAGLGALWFGVSNFVDAVRDLRHLPRARQEPGMHTLHYRMLRTVAVANVRDEVFRTTVALLIIASGAVGVVTPNPLGGRTGLTGLFVTISLVGIAALTALRGWFDARTRRELYETAGHRVSRRKTPLD